MDSSRGRLPAALVVLFAVVTAGIATMTLTPETYGYIAALTVESSLLGIAGIALIVSKRLL